MSQKTCQKCGRQYPEEAQVCEDCDEALVDESQASPPASQERPPKMILLTTVPEAGEAAILCNVLAAEGIDAVAEDMDLLKPSLADEMSVTDGIPIVVNAKDAERAVEVLKLHREGKLAILEDETVGSAVGSLPLEAPPTNSLYLVEVTTVPAEAEGIKLVNSLRGEGIVAFLETSNEKGQPLRVLVDAEQADEAGDVLDEMARSGGRPV